MNELKNLIQLLGKYINVFQAKESVTDELEGTVSLVYYNPIPVRGILTDMTDAQAVYKIPGIQTTQAKIFVTHKSNKQIILSSHKIEIDNEEYYGFKDGNGDKIRIKQEGDYIRVYLVRKIYA